MERLRVVFQVCCVFVLAGCVPARPRATDRGLATEVLPFLASNRFKSVDEPPTHDCKAPGEEPALVRGIGQGSYLGHFEVTLVICAAADRWKDGHATFVAENGDRLHVQTVGRSFQPNTVQVFETSWWLVRGTGRFAGLVGGGMVRGTVDLTTGAGSALWEGKLTASPNAEIRGAPAPGQGEPSPGTPGNRTE